MSTTTGTTNSSYITAFQAYLADKAQHAKHTENRKVFGVFKKTINVPQSAMNRTKVQKFLRATFNAIELKHTKEPLFREAADQSHLENPEAPLTGVLLTARVKAAFARNPELYLSPTPVQAGNVKSMATPLLLDMMSNDADGTLNTGKQGDDARFSPAHLARFLANVSLASGGGEYAALLAMPEDQRGGLTPTPRATLVTALGFNYDNRTGELLISLNLSAKVDELKEVLEATNDAIDVLVADGATVGDKVLTQMKEQRASLRRQLDVILPELTRLKELSLHLRLTQVDNALDALDRESKSLTGSVRALTPEYKGKVQTLQTLKAQLLQEQKEVKQERLKQRAITIQQIVCQPHLPTEQLNKLNRELQVVAKELQRLDAGTHDTLLRSALQAAKDRLTTLDDTTDITLTKTVLTLIELAVMPKSDPALKQSAKQWLVKNQAQLLAAAPGEGKRTELEKALNRLLGDSMATRTAKVASFATACVLANPSLVRGGSKWGVGLKVAALLGVAVGVTDQKSMERVYDQAMLAKAKLVREAKQRLQALQARFTKVK